MPPQNKIQMSHEEQARVFQFPCDEVPRYVLGKKQARLTYSEAYDAIFAVTGCKINEQDERILSLEGVNRLKALNRHYCQAAAQFISDWFVEHQKKVAAARENSPASAAHDKEVSP